MRNMLPAPRADVSESLETSIKNKACSLGFAACGIAQAAAVDEATADYVRQWVHHGCQGDMQWMSRNIEKRLDPTLLVEGCKSLIVVVLNYLPPRRLSTDALHTACYAYGRDYHEVIREKLSDLLAWMNAIREIPHSRASNLKHAQRIFVDTAPLLERYWAQKAGLGWIGKHHQLIVPHAGSYHFIGVLTTDLILQPDTPGVSHCGTCHRCLDACPTGALSSSASGPTFDARRCLSYLTVEYKGELAPATSSMMHKCIAGCDVCQEVCPWNRFAVPTSEQAFCDSTALLAMKDDDWRNMSAEQFAEKFTGTALAHIGYDSLRRNIAICDADDT